MEPKSAEKKSKLRPYIGPTYRYIEQCVGLGIKLNALPFTYDRSNLRYQVNTSGIKFKLWLVTMPMIIVLELGQIVIELGRGKRDETMSRGEWCLVAFLSFSWLFMALIHLNVLLHPHELVNQLNQLVRVRQWFGEDKLPPTTDHKVVRAQMWFCSSQCFVQALMICVEREKQQFFYSYVPQDYQNVGTVMVWVAYAYYRVATNFLAALKQYFVSILFVQTCNQILDLRLEIQKLCAQEFDTLESQS